MIGIAKEKAKENELGATDCIHPGVGEHQLAAYLAGEITEDAGRKFIAHVAECMYCLEQIVLWKMAEELAETADQPSKAVHTA